MCISWVPEGHTAVIERFGQFSRVQEAGIYFYIPGIYTTKSLTSWGNIANKSGYLIEKSEQQTNTPTRHCQTKDNVIIQANTSIGWKIIDSKKAVYATDHLPTMISELALNSLRANIGTLSLNELFSSRRQLSEKINSELSETLIKWGVELSRVEIRELTYTDEIAKAMMKEMVAEKERKAQVLLAQGEAEAKLMRAKSDAEAVELNAMGWARALLVESEAQSKALKMQAESEKIYLRELKEEVGAEHAAQILTAEKQKEGLKSISENPAHKIFLAPQMQYFMPSAV